jgi:hypothetical protein
MTGNEEQFEPDDFIPRKRNAIACRRLLESLLREHPEYAPSDLGLRMTWAKGRVANKRIGSRRIGGLTATALVPPNHLGGTGKEMTWGIVHRIIGVVSAHFGVDPNEMVSRARNARVAYARQIALYMAREITGNSMGAIALHFSRRDHTTIMYAIRKIELLCQEDFELRTTIDRLTQLVGSKGQIAA